jgi:hypothetical protein
MRMSAEQDVPWLAHSCHPSAGLLLALLDAQCRLALHKYMDTIAPPTPLSPPLSIVRQTLSYPFPPTGITIAI